MKVLIKRDQKSGMLGKAKFLLYVRAQLEPEESELVKKYRLGGELLVYHDKTGPTTGFMSVVWSRIKDTALTVASFEHGTQFECDNVGELLGIEEQVKEAAKNFKGYLQAAKTFGGEEVLAV